MNLRKRYLLQQPHDSQGDDTGQGAAGAGGETGAGLSDQEVQQRIKAEVEQAVAGLKSKNQELLGSLKEAKEQLKQFEGIDPGAVREILKRFADDEEANLIKAGKIDEVLTKRTERMKAEYDKQLKAAIEKAEAAEKRAQKFQGRVLDDAIRAAASKVGIHQHAIDDALLRGRALFSLNDDGEAVQLGDDGKPVLGKDGKSPFSPLEWLEGMKETAPHWFPASASGGGAGGGGSGGGSSAKKAQDMSPQEKVDFIGKYGLEKWNEKVKADYA